MGQNGGKRPGAGRKKIADDPRPTRTQVESATAAIDNAQPRSARVLIEALEATIERNRIVGRDDNNNPIYEYYEVPDHNTRIRAATALLNKRIPDVQRTELSDPDGNKITFQFVDYTSKSKK